jgi:ArsR family transcriptional regulator
MTIQEAAEIASVLGNSQRLKILHLLLQSHAGGVIVGDIQGAIGMPGSTLSHHLERLKESGLVTVRRQGTFLWYLAAPDRLRGLADLLLDLSAGPTTTRPAEPLALAEPTDEVEIEAD